MTSVLYESVERCCSRLMNVLVEITVFTFYSLNLASHMKMLDAFSYDSFYWEAAIFHFHAW